MAEKRTYPGAHGIKVCENVGKCIHSRVCVTRLNRVFIPNAQGPWIEPNAASREEVIGTVTGCPSGALTYETTDGSPGERPPTVNTIRLWENGPLEVRGDLHISGEPEPSLRATLCRCGHSRNKPFCDLSHQAQGFNRTGETETVPSEPLPKRDGVLDISWEKNGPLLVQGNVEVIAGSGRTIYRHGEGVLRLCRCGLSANSPFCDGSHAREGFEDDSK